MALATIVPGVKSGAVLKVTVNGVVSLVLLSAGNTGVLTSPTPSR